MRRFRLRIELIEDVVFSARSATVGGHGSLDYVPGAALLGAAAATAYDQVTDSFAVFHSGRVRFGNGLPTACAGNDTVAWPIPFCWSVAKHGSHRQPLTPALLNGQGISNAVITPAVQDTSVQHRQLREGYVSANGALVEPITNFRMKTAINPLTGTAADGQLFGYQALQAGQTFQSFLDVDDGISAEDVTQVVASLTGPIYLGRSRSAQYGRCESTVEEIPVACEPMCGLADDEITLWFISDVVLMDDMGMPQLTPTPAAFGLPTGQMNVEKSAIRVRQYSHYNGKRRAYDKTLQVLQQGSVVVFNLNNTAPQSTLSHLQQYGVGHERQLGFGQVLVDHALVTQPSPMPTSIDEPTVQPTHKPENSFLADWLDVRASRTDGRYRDRLAAERLGEELRKLYASAYRYAGNPAYAIGPSKTQWGHVGEIAKRSGRDREKLVKALATVCKNGDEQWSIATGESDEASEFRTWLMHRAQQESVNEIEVNHAGNMIAILARIGRDIVDAMERRK